MKRSPFKPEASCCDSPSRSHLRCDKKLSDGWVWTVLLGGAHLPVNFCPFCGTRLPRRRAPGLKLVKAGDAS